MKPANKDATQIIPSTASPVLKTSIKLKIEANFPFPINNPDDFTVNMTLISISTQVSPYYKKSQNTNVRRLNVIGANETDGSIEAMFGGAYSGIYSVQVRHVHFGLIDTAALRFTVGSEVTTFSP